MDNLINVNREMADALRSLALAGPEPVSKYVNVPAALTKLGIKCHRVERELLIEGRDALTLADYIDRPVGDADEAQRSRADIAMSIRGTVSDAAEEMTAGGIRGGSGRIGVCDLVRALGMNVRSYKGQIPSVEQSAARDLADKIDVQTCRYVRERVGVWICDKCGHDEGKYGAYFYRHCPICGRVIEKTVEK